MNPFLRAIQRYDTYTENGAVSHSTTGDALVDYFAKCGTHKGRSQLEVDADLSRCWAESPKVTLQILFWLRLITRPMHGFLSTEVVQKGQGARDEFRKGLVWLSTSHPDVLRRNLWLVPTVGVWKDLWHADTVDVLPRDDVYALIERGLEDPFHRNLLAKYLPRLRSSGQRFNPRHHALHGFGRGLCARLGWTSKQYRAFKASGRGHQFQREMSAGRWDTLRFQELPGRALFTLVNHVGKDGKTTLARHDQEDRYVAWIEQQPVAPFTGYVHELFQAAVGNRRRYSMQNLSRARKLTLDRQFDGLIELARRDGGGLDGNVWCALDTSGSMSGLPYEICVSLGIYFSTLNTGAFQDHVVMFDSRSRVLKLKGSFTDKARQIAAASTAWGSTNFQSVIDEIVRVRKQSPAIPVSDFPNTLLVVSDMQFNPTGDSTTNYEMAMKKLAAVGLPRVRVIWWWVTARGKDFPSTIEDEGVTMIGGYDGAVVTLLLGGETTTVDAKTGKKRQLNAVENMLKALDQEALRAVRVSG